MSSLSKILGSSLNSCTFSAGFYSFEFERVIEGVETKFVVSTDYNVSDIYPDFENVQDACADISRMIWPILGSNLTNVVSHNDELVWEFVFANEARFFIWSYPGEKMDNIAIVTMPITDEWFVIG